MTSSAFFILVEKRRWYGLPVRIEARADEHSPSIVVWRVTIYGHDGTTVLEVIESCLRNTAERRGRRDAQKLSLSILKESLQ